MQQHQQQQQQHHQYTEQLGRIMYGLGDFPSSSCETLRLLEDFLRLRLGRWVQAAAAAAAAAAGDSAESPLTPETLVAALRSDRRALAHCVMYHGLLADCRLAGGAGDGGDEGGGNDGDDDADEFDGEGEVAAAASAVSAASTRKLPPYLESAAADASDVLPQMQAERHRRMMRLSSCSEGLGQSDYQRFAQCRSCSLLSRASGGAVSRAEYLRFRRWLGPAGGRLSNESCRLLNYLAHQTMAELVDSVKQRRADTWPAAALHFEGELSASAAEMQEAMERLG